MPASMFTKRSVLGIAASLALAAGVAITTMLAGPAAAQTTLTIVERGTEAFWSLLEGQRGRS